VGHGDQLLTSHDMSGKNRLARYGGHGYAHTLANITPHMRRRGYEESMINKLLVENPARILAFIEPKEA
jgi:phosphotriesterase-related protein